jgi:hypothetical protein
MGIVRLKNMPDTEINTQDNITNINEYGISAEEVEQRVEDGKDKNVTEIDDTDSPYTLTADDRIVSCDTSGGAVTVKLVSSSVVNPGHEFKIVCKSNANAVTVDVNGNTRNGVGTNGSVTSSGSGNYGVKIYTLLNASNDYLEE